MSLANLQMKTEQLQETLVECERHFHEYGAVFFRLGEYPSTIEFDEIGDDGEYFIKVSNPEGSTEVYRSPDFNEILIYIEMEGGWGGFQVEEEF